MQLARIERREARLRRLRAKLNQDSPTHAEPVANTPQQHHHIGSSQKLYEHIGTFLQKFSGDPAVKVSAKAALELFHKLNDMGRTQEFSAQTQDAPAPNHSKS
jgi:hypothetical protein